MYSNTHYVSSILGVFLESPDEAPAISPRVLAKQLNIGNPAHLEKRIRKELEEQGINMIFSILVD